MHGVGEEEALVQTKMDPCSDKMVSCKVASVCKVGTNLNGPPFSFRCRSPGAHRIRASPGADGGGAQCAHWAEGASTRPRPAAHHFFTIHSYLLLLLGSPAGGAKEKAPPKAPSALR